MTDDNPPLGLERADLRHLLDEALATLPDAQRHTFVLHARRFPKAEGQMVGFPKAAYDDLVDAIGNGVAKYLGQPKSTPLGDAKTMSYT